MIAKPEIKLGKILKPNNSSINSSTVGMRKVSLTIMAFKAR